MCTEAHIQFSELNEKYAAAVRENEELKKLLARETEKNTLKTKSTFGRKTENFLSLLDAKDHPEEEPVDESPAEDAGPAKERRVRAIDFGLSSTGQSFKVTFQVSLWMSL